MIDFLAAAPATESSSAIDFIGFIIGVMALLFLIGRTILAQRRSHDRPEEAHRADSKQKDTLKTFLKSLEIDMDESETVEVQEKKRLVKRNSPPPPPAKSIRENQLQSHKAKPYKAEIVRENYDLKYAPDSYSKKLLEISESSYGQKLVARLHSKKDMVVLQQILMPPKALEKGDRGLF